MQADTVEAEAQLGAGDVAAALQRIIDSGVLGKASRLPALLEYVVKEELAGRGNMLKAYAIGVDVFGRPEDFNPSVDSIVRVEFSRLRQALAHYYATSGQADAARITLEAGSYRPVFTKSEQPQPGARAESQGRRSSPWIIGVLLVIIAALIAVIWERDKLADIIIPPPAEARVISLLVEPVVSGSNDLALATLATGLRNQLLTLLGQSRSFKVQAVDASASIAVPARDLAYRVRLALVKDDGVARLVVRLVSNSGQELWGESCTRQFEPNGLLALQDDLLRCTASDIRLQTIASAKRDLELRKGTSPRAWDNYLQAAWVPGQDRSSLAWEQQRIELARRAIALSPDFGQAHALLAEKLAYLAMVDHAQESENLLEEARGHVQKAIEFSANDADTVFHLSAYYWFSGNADEAKWFVQRSLELDPYRTLEGFLSGTMKYACGPPPADVLQDAVKRDMALSADNPFRWLTLSWISLLAASAGDWPLAEESSRRSVRIFATPETYMRYAAILVHLGRRDEALGLINDQRGNWPSFDPGRYARTVIARRCGEQVSAAGQAALYAELAAILPR